MMCRDKNEANEPQTGCHTNVSHGAEISFFSSIQQQEEAHYQWLASLTPEQHLQNAEANIKRIYAKELIENIAPIKELRFE